MGDVRMTEDRFLRLPEVLAKTGLRTSTIYKMVGNGAFPKQCQLGVRAVAWRQSEVDAWMAERRPAAAIPPPQ